MIIDGIDITAEGFAPLPGELDRYVEYVTLHTNDDVDSIHVKLCDDGCVDIVYVKPGQKFERIRRITG